MIKSLLHHTLCLGHSQRQCAQALGVSKGVVAKYTTAATAAGLDWAAIEPMDEATLERRLFPARAQAAAPVLPDFAGPTLALADGARAHLFVSAMGASHYTYAQALPAEKTQDWITGMTSALHFMDGVPELIVPDNARAIIARPDRYEPRANDTVLDFARHYGCTILPARPYTPQDKASVESAVQVVERWILARLAWRPRAGLLRAARLRSLAVAGLALPYLSGHIRWCDFDIIVKRVLS